MVPPLLPPFEVKAQSSENAVRQALAGLMDGLKPLDLSQEELGTVELVIAEALNNIVEHAYPTDNAPGDIDLLCTHKSDGLHFCIRDQGVAMPDGKIPLGTQPDVDVNIQDLPEGGYGWFLIHGLAKDITYSRNDTGNALKMRIAVGIVN